MVAAPLFILSVPPCTIRSPFIFMATPAVPKIKLPVPVFTIVKLPPKVVGATSAMERLAFCPGQFQVNLPKVCPLKLPAVVLVIPVTLSNELAFQVAVGIAPPFSAWLNVEPELNVKVAALPLTVPPVLLVIVPLTCINELAVLNVSVPLFTTVPFTVTSVAAAPLAMVSITDEFTVKVPFTVKSSAVALAVSVTLSPLLINIPSLFISVGRAVAAIGAGLVKFISLETSQVLRLFHAVLPVLR